MASNKFTFLFNWGTRAGWTETFYHDVEANSSFDGLQRQLAIAWADKRARCLSAKAMIIACRASPVAEPRNVSLIVLNRPGVIGKGILLNNNQDADVPNVAQLVVFTAQTGTKRNYLQRGLPDDDVVDGKITFASNGQGVYRDFWEFLRTGTWCMRDNIPGASTGILKIDNQTRIMTNVAQPNYGDGQLITIHTRIAGNGLKTYWTGRCRPSLDTSVYLKNWHLGDCAGGISFPLVPSYPRFTGWWIPDPNWARTRQTGRSFGQPRGRAPKRT